jgi:thioredoxin-like negative regulator of GroEL
VDVDETPEVSQRYSVSAMPTIIFFVAGVEKGKVVGANMAEISAILRSLSGGTTTGFSGTGHTLSGKKASSSNPTTNAFSSSSSSSIYMFGIIGLALVYFYMTK